MNKKKITDQSQALPALVPPVLRIPVRFSDSQPLPGATLDAQSLLREILEHKLPHSTLRKL